MNGPQKRSYNPREEHTMHLSVAEQNSTAALIAYASALGAHISCPIKPAEAGRIVGGFLSPEED